MHVSLEFKKEHLRKMKLRPDLEKIVINAMKKRSWGIGMDYDRTMVDTDEKKRKFPPFIRDKSRVIEPMGGLAMVGVPIAILTGNKPSYLKVFCIDGYKSWLEKKGLISAMQGLHIYSQNATWLEVFNHKGEIIKKVTDEYKKNYAFPKKDIKAIELAFIPIIHTAVANTFMSEEPIKIRPEGSKEIQRAYGPIFENRGGVQLSWIAIAHGENEEDLRGSIIADTIKVLSPELISKYRFEPGGQFSIDINHNEVAKHIGTKHFREKMGISSLLYFGDSVYEKDGHKGNDLPVIDDEGTIIFAVNPNQNDPYIPKDSRIILAGSGPDATRAWLTWLLAKYISLRLVTESLSSSKKMEMLKAITETGLEEDIEIK